MKYSDEEIKPLLRKLRDKKRRYIRQENKMNNVILDELKTAFDKSSLFDDHGKIISLEEFKTKFAGVYNYKIAIINDMLKRTYIRDKLKIFKENTIKMMRNIGLNEEAQDTEQMSMKEFLEKYRKGDFEKIVERYEYEAQVDVAEKIARKEARQGLTKEEKEMLFGRK